MDLLIHRNNILFTFLASTIGYSRKKINYCFFFVYRLRLTLFRVHIFDIIKISIITMMKILIL